MNLSILHTIVDIIKITATLLTYGTSLNVPQGSQNAGIYQLSCFNRYKLQGHLNGIIAKGFENKLSGSL